MDNLFQGVDKEKQWIESALLEVPQMPLMSAEPKQEKPPWKDLKQLEQATEKPW